MSLDDRHCLGFYEYPKLFDLQTGAVVQSWPDIRTGKQMSSIIWHMDPVPPIALDSINGRFAVANESEITVIQLAP